MFINKIWNYKSLLFQIPESPSWLISKRHSNKALKSLQWLRGIVPPQAVSNEFEKLKRHIELSKTCADCKKLETQCTHRPPTICEKFRKMKQKRTMKPFMMILILQFFMQFSGMAAMRPYIVLILNAHGIPLDSNSATIFLGLLSILALACLMLTIRWLGKRKIFLYSMVASFITYFALCKLPNQFYCIFNIFNFSIFCFWKAHMDLCFSHLVGHHSIKTSTRIIFERLLATGAISRSLWFWLIISSFALAFRAYPIFYRQKCFHSSKSCKLYIYQKSFVWPNRLFNQNLD